MKLLDKQTKLKCEHEWKLDKLFEDKVVIMLVGDITHLVEERRYVCLKCGSIQYGK